MRKNLFYALTAALLLLLCACGNTASEPAASQEAPEPFQEAGVEFVELDETSVIAREGDYVLSKLYSDILTEAAVADGWFYYFSEGTESQVPWEEWTCGDGMYTSCELLFDMQNLSENQTVPFLQRFDGMIVYNLDLSGIPDCATAPEYLAQIRAMAPENPEAELFAFTPLQRNPGQVDSEGYETRSKDAVTLPCGDTAPAEETETSAAETQKPFFLGDWVARTAEINGETLDAKDVMGGIFLLIFQEDGDCIMAIDNQQAKVSWTCNDDGTVTLSGDDTYEVRFPEGSEDTLIAVIKGVEVAMEKMEE